MTSTITVIGTGGWGTAVALLAVGNGHRVRLWGRDAENVARIGATRENERFLPGITLPDALELTADLEAARDADLVICGVPTAYLVPIMERFVGIVPAGVPLLSLTKGIDVATHERPSQMLARLFPGHGVGSLSGPSHAEEVARGIPSSVVLAASDQEEGLRMQGWLGGDRFRIYTNDDLVGVEIAGALKNVVSIAAGIGDGLGFGDNTKAALVTRGLVEIARLGTALGARKDTFAGLAGMGDLITSAFSRHGRNRAVGERIGAGETLDEILANTASVAEGVRTSRAAMALAATHDVDMPIVREVTEMLFEKKDPEAALRDLMGRASKPETW